MRKDARTTGLHVKAAKKKKRYSVDSAPLKGRRANLTCF